MSKIYTTYCVLLVSMMALANHQGFTVFSNFLAADAKAEKSANRYHK